MRLPETRCPGRFAWEKSGRQYVLRIAGLSACVEIVGNRRRGYGFRTGDIFGNPLLGSRATTTLDDAILEVERIVLGVAPRLAFLVKASRPHKATPGPERSKT